MKMKLIEQSQNELVFRLENPKPPSRIESFDFYMNSFSISILVTFVLSGASIILEMGLLTILVLFICALYNILLPFIIDLISQHRRQSEPVTTCTIDSTGVALVVDRPIEQKRVYKPDEVGFSAESIFNSWSGEINIKLTLGSGSETEELMIYCVGRSLANEIALILHLPIPFPPPPRCKTYDIYDDDAWLVSHLSFYPDTQTVKITAGHQSGWGVSRDFERTVRLQDIADIRGEIDGSADRYSYRFVVVLQSGERLILVEDGYGGSGATPEERTAYLENKVKAEEAQMRKFLHECSCFDVK